MKRGDTLRITKTFGHIQKSETVCTDYLILRIKENIITVRSPLGYVFRLNINNFKRHGTYEIHEH